MQIADGTLTGATDHTSYILMDASGEKICWSNVLVNNLTYAKVMYSTGEGTGDDLYLKYNGTTKATFPLTTCGAWAGDCREDTAGFTSTNGRGELCLEGSGTGWIASVAHVIIGEWY